MDMLKVLVVANSGFFPADLGNFQLIGSLLNLENQIRKVSIPPFFLSSVQLEKLEKLSLVMCNIGQAFSNSVIRMPNLKEINIEYCKDLVELPVGICDLIHLERLIITNCHKFSALPEEIEHLVNLEVLRLNSCIELEELPDPIGRLHNLPILDISETDITKLAYETCQLSKLRKLYMIDCSNCELPESVKNLVNLKEVIGSETKRQPIHGKILQVSSKIWI